MAIEHIHTYLVHPHRNAGGTPKIGGTSVKLDGKLFRLLDGIFSTAADELDIEISFNANRSGKQQNDCRDLLVAYVSNPTLVGGRRIAERLAKKTDKRSGLGLLFLMAGKASSEHRLVISRFPTDIAILAEQKRAALTVSFLERVFMKSATSYKAVGYQDSSLTTGFWQGQAIDKQINSRITEVSNYWIVDFLDSEFLVTPAAGTRRLALALRDAARLASDVSVKSEIAAVATLASNMQGRQTNISNFIQRFGLSAAATNAVLGQLKTKEMATEQFRFDVAEFRNQLGYRSVELNNGGILIAETSSFDKVFHQEVVDRNKDRRRFSTEGSVVDDKLRKSK